MEIGQVGQDRARPVDLDTIIITDTSADSGENRLGQLRAPGLTQISELVHNMALQLMDMRSKEQTDMHNS